MASSRFRLPEGRFFVYASLLLAAILLNTAGGYSDDLIAAADKRIQPLLASARQLAPIAPAVLSVAAILLAEARATAAERQKTRESAGLALAVFIREVFRGEEVDLIRANVMKVERESLVVLCHSPNMAFSVDKALAFEKGQGCCGKAWQRASTLQTEARQFAFIAPDVPRNEGVLESEWLLSREQIEATRRVRWIVSIPLFEAEDGSGECRGILNFDGIHKKPRARRFFALPMQRTYIELGRGVAKELRRLRLL